VETEPRIADGPEDELPTGEDELCDLLGMEQEHNRNETREPLMLLPVYQESQSLIPLFCPSSYEPISEAKQNATFEAVKLIELEKFSTLEFANYFDTEKPGRPCRRATVNAGGVSLQQFALEGLGLKGIDRDRFVLHAGPRHVDTGRYGAVSSIQAFIDLDSAIHIGILK